MLSVQVTVTAVAILGSRVGRIVTRKLGSSQALGVLAVGSWAFHPAEGLGSSAIGRGAGPISCSSSHLLSICAVPGTLQDWSHFILPETLAGRSEPVRSKPPPQELALHLPQVRR